MIRKRSKRKKRLVEIKRYRRHRLEVMWGKKIHDLSTMSTFNMITLNIWNAENFFNKRFVCCINHCQLSPYTQKSRYHSSFDHFYSAENVLTIFQNCPTNSFHNLKLICLQFAVNVRVFKHILIEQSRPAIQITKLLSNRIIKTNEQSIHICSSLPFPFFLFETRIEKKIVPSLSFFMPKWKAMHTEMGRKNIPNERKKATKFMIVHNH